MPGLINAHNGHSPCNDFAHSGRRDEANREPLLLSGLEGKKFHSHCRFNNFLSLAPNGMHRIANVRLDRVLIFHDRSAREAQISTRSGNYEFVLLSNIQSGERQDEREPLVVDVFHKFHLG